MAFSHLLTGPARPCFSQRRIVVARRRALALLTSTVLAVGVGLPVLVSAPPASAATNTVTLTGSIQEELGCPGDWQPDCAATHLQRVGTSTAFRGEFDVPAGSYEFKMAINDSWAESYGAGGGNDNIPLVLKGAARLAFAYDDVTHKISVTPTVLAGSATGADRALATRSLRESLTRERFYFVMTDRFANADPANDQGGLTGDRLATGLDPTDKGFYHGGDLKGLTGKLDYIQGLGTTAIWLTPSFKNKPVQGAGTDASAGYHGYWTTDFTQIDPHLGTNAGAQDPHLDRARQGNEGLLRHHHQPHGGRHLLPGGAVLLPEQGGLAVQRHHGQGVRRQGLRGEAPASPR